MAALPVIIHPPLLPPPDCQAGDTAAAYGRALFAHVLTCGYDSTLTDEQIDLALHASAAFLSAPYSDLVRTRVTDTRRMLSRTQVRRAVADVVAMPGGVTPDQPNIGPMAPLSPVPTVRPPGGVSLEILTDDPLPSGPAGGFSAAEHNELGDLVASLGLDPRDTWTTPVPTWQGRHGVTPPAAVPIVDVPTVKPEPFDF